MQLTILTEAGQGMGLGHWMRMRAVASTAQQQGHSVQLHLEYRGPAPTDMLPHEQLTPWWQGTFPLATDLVLVDSYQVRPAVLAAWKNQAPLALMDDQGRTHLSADLIINPNLCFDLLDYSGLNARGGSGFALLRPNFEHASAITLRPHLTQVLCMAGGEDASGLLPWLMQHLPPPLAVTVITGSDITQTQLQQLFPQHRVLGKLSPEQLCQTMQQHDLLISAAGQTLHEAAHLGLPSLGIVVSADQALHLQALVQKGVCPVYLERQQSDLAAQIDGWLQRLADLPLRQELSQRGQTAIPSGGARRLVSELEHLLRTTRSPIVPSQRHP